MASIKHSLPAVTSGPIGRALEKLSLALRRNEPPQDRRVHLRIPAHGTVTLSPPERPGGERQEPVHVIDISPQGLAVRCTRALPVGDKVTLGSGRLAVTGIVRRCTPDGSEFTLGIELSPGEHGSPNEVLERILET